MGSSASEAKRVPALKRIWDAPVERFDVDRLGDGDRRRVPGGARYARGGGRSGARAAGPARDRSLGAFRLRSESRAGTLLSALAGSGVPVIYGLTERYRKELGTAPLVANPGCYPTAAILALQPLIAAGLIQPGVIIDAKSGVSGAGKTPSERTHFSEVHGSIAAYGVFSHRHEAEIEQELGMDVTFVPHLVPLDRGILETIYARLTAGVDAEAIERTLEAAYADSPFVRLTGSDLPEIKHVAHTNYCDIGWRVDQPGGQLVMVVVHRQPGEGCGRTGDPELQRRVRVRRNDGVELRTILE